MKKKSRQRKKKVAPKVRKCSSEWKKDTSPVRSCTHACMALTFLSRIYIQQHLVNVLVRSESWNPCSSGNCCFSGGEEFSSTKNKQNEVGIGMQLSSKQNKNIKLWDIPEVTSFITNLSLHGQLIGRGLSGKFKAWFYGKSIIIHFFGFENINFLDVIEIPKPKRKPFGRLSIGNL